MKKNFILFLLISVYLGAFSSPGNSVFIESVRNPAALNLGMVDSFSFKIYNITSPAQTVKNVVVRITMPNGITYLKNTIGKTDVVITPGKVVDIYLDSLTGGQTSTVSFKVNTDCYTKYLVNTNTLFANKYKVSYTTPSANYDEITAASYLVSLPALSITNIVNKNKTVTYGSKYNRDIDVLNGGNGYLKTFDLQDAHGLGVVLDSVKILNSTGSEFPITILQNTTSNLLVRINTSDIKNYAINTDGDSILELNEKIRIREYVRVVSCTVNGNSTINSKYGCGIVGTTIPSTYCDSSFTTASILFGSLSPNLTFTNFNSQDNFCFGDTAGSIKKLLIKNIGAAPARNVDLTIATGWYSTPSWFAASLNLSKIDTSSIYIQNGVNGTATRLYPDSALLAANTNASYDFKYLMAFGNVRQIAGFRKSIDFIDINDSIIISFKMIDAVNTNNCIGNNHHQNWEVKGSYKDACLFNSYTISNMVQNARESGTITLSGMNPSDASDGDTINYEMTFTGYSGGYSTNNQAIELYFDMPNCLTWLGDSSSFTLVNPNNVLQKQKPLKIYRQNNSLVVRYKFPMIFNPISSIINLNAKVSCQNCGTGTISVNTYYKFIADTLCETIAEKTSSCGFVSNVNLHCPGGVCVGLENIKFSAERANFGKPDNNNDGIADTTGVINKSIVRTNRLMAGDTLVGLLIGRIHTNDTLPSFQYGKATITMPSTNFVVVKGKVTIYSDTLQQFFVIDNIPVTKSNTQAAVNISPAYLRTYNAALPAGYLYREGDSIATEIYVSPTNNIGNTITLYTISTEYFVSNYATPTASWQKKMCDNWSGNFQYMGYTFESYFAPSTTVLNGCNSFYYQGVNILRIGGDWNLNPFPYEYRNWSYMNQSQLVLPAGYSFQSNSYYAAYRVNGNNSYTSIGNQPLVPARIGYNGTGDTLYFDLKSTYKNFGGNNLLPDDGWNYSLIVYAYPSCKVASGVAKFARWRNTHTNTAAILQTNEIAKTQGDESYSPYVIGAFNNTSSTTFQGPFINFQSTQPVQDGYTSTVKWEAVLSNTSSSALSLNNWISIDTLHSKIKIVAVRNKSNNAIITPVNGIYQVGSIAASSSYTMEIEASYSNCNSDSIRVYSGWDCTSYPANFAAYTCPKNNIVLTVDPKGSTLQSQIITQPSGNINLCDTLEFEYLVRNVSLASLYNIQNDITLPIGFNFVPGSAKVKFPKNTGTYTTTTSIQQQNDTLKLNLNSFSTFIQNNGLKGVTDADSSGFYFKIKVTTACTPGIEGGRKVQLINSGRTYCGALSNQISTNTNSLKFNSSSALYDAQINLSVINNSLIGCRNNDLKVNFKNIGTPPFGPNNPTGNNDTIVVYLPAGVSYVANSMNGIHNTTNVEPLINGNMLSWKIKAGINYLDSFVFTIGLNVTNHSTCDTANTFLSESYIKGNALCSFNGSSCFLRMFSASTSLTVPVKKPIITISNLTAVSKPFLTSGETVTFSFDITNTGIPVDSLVNPLTVYLYSDYDNNHQLNNGDNFIITAPINRSIATNQTISVTRTSNVAAGRTCHFLAAIDSNYCSCSAAVNYNAALPHLSNAGIDAEYCSGDSVQIGMQATTGYSYSWSPAVGLSSSSVANPIVHYINSGQTDTVIQYVLQTNKVVCTTYDTVLVKIKPRPSILINNIDNSICSGENTNIQITKSINDADVLWTAQGGLGSTSGSGNFIAQTLINTNGSTKTVYYTITPHYNGCVGKSVLDSVSVNVAPFLSVNHLVDSICSGEQTAIAITTTMPSATISWIANGLNSTSGQGNTIAQTLINNTSEKELVTYTISSMYQGCVSNQIIDSVWVGVSQPIVAGSSYGVYCTNEPLQLFASGKDDATYTWESPSHTFYYTKNVSIPAVKDSFVGNWIVSSSYFGCSAFSDTLSVAINKIDSQFKLHTFPSFATDLSDSWTVSWIDYDNDGWDDLFFANKSMTGQNLLYRNNQNGSFTKITTGDLITNLSSATGNTWSDIDNDGDLDVLITNVTQKPNFLYINNGNGTFTLDASAAMCQTIGYYHGAAWADYDKDGFVDLFICNYFSTRFNEFYRNNGDGTFVKVTNTPISQQVGSGVSASWADINNDSYPDLFVPNRNGGNNSIFINDKKGSFTKLTTGIVVAEGGNSIASCWGDYDNDGDLDLFVANTSGQNNYLYNNDGTGIFTKITQGAIVNDGGDSHGCAWIDIENDGDLDLYVTNDVGLKFLYLNQGNGTFVKDESTILSPNYGLAFGESWSDFDRDGDIDVAVATHSNTANKVFVNQGNCNNFINIKLVGVVSNKSALGAKIYVLSNGEWQMHEVVSQSGLSGQNSFSHTFGLGRASNIDSIYVLWPSGYVQTLSDETVNQFMVLTEESSYHIEGVLYNDANNNCIKDSNEAVFAHQTVLIQPNNIYATTDDNGQYYVNLQEGAYTINQQSISNFQQTCSQSYSTTLSITNQSYVANFAYVAPTPVYDLAVDLSQTALRRGFHNNLQISYTNNGTTTSKTDTLFLILPPEIKALGASIPWTAKVGNTYIWILDSIQVGEFVTIAIEDSLSATAPLNTTLNISARITLNSDESISTNNYKTISGMVVGAIDPNDISVSPRGLGEDGLVDISDTLTYRIRFQNTGNYFAQNIKVVNPIPANVAYEDIQLVATSHSAQFYMTENTMVWYFKNINLPDSNTNEVGSHGFIDYKILPSNKRVEGAVLKNNATILFDYEEPVKTNTVKNTFLHSITKNGSLEVYPNPATDFVSFRKIENDNLVKIQEVTILTSANEAVLNQTFSNQFIVKIEIASLQPGFYIARIKDANNKYDFKKIIVY